MEKQIVFFDATLLQGGAERVISLLSAKIAENENVTVRILLYKDQEPFYEIDPRVHITYVSRETGTENPLRNLIWMRSFYRKNADVVISFLAPYNILTLLATLGGKQTVIVADRNDPRFVPSNPLIRAVRDFLYRLADGVIVQTKHNQSYFSEAIQKKSRIIYNPVDMKEKAELALRTQKEKTIVSVGRLMPQKNQIMLLEAFAEIHNDYPEHRLIIYGDGPYRKTLEEKIQALEIQEYVDMPGSFKDIHDRIASAEVFVLSSNYEGMPNALIEAMCLGLPVISTAVSGATDLIQHGENGLLVDVGDRKALADALRTLLRDNAMRHSLGSQATKLNQQLKIEDITAQWLEAVAQYSNKE